MQRHWSRTLIAVIVAPLLGGAAGGLILMVVGAIEDKSITIPAMAILFFAFGGLVLGAIIGIPLMATLGLLVHRWFCMIGWTRWWHYMLAGTIGGMLPSAAHLWSLDFFGKGDFFDNVFNRLMFVLTLMSLWMSGGAVTGGFVWLIRRPDRDGCDAVHADIFAE